METENLQTIAKRANATLSTQPGFLSCSVESENPPILAFSFSAPADAVRFQMIASFRCGDFKYGIKPGCLDTVLEYR